ncbi:MAG: DUF4390 domain-containing protein [Nitrosomonas sp.]|nr:MAG: DUF4390 domain-containing protein [Nitrosomonas sp.]
MPYSTKADGRAARVRSSIVYLLWLSLLFSCAAVQAQGIQIKSVSVAAQEQGYSLGMDAEIALNATLEQALEKGIVLYFAVKFSLVDARWYWLDDEVVRGKYRIGLRYYALTRQYHLNHPSFTQSFNTLREALQAAGRLRDYPLTVKANLKQDTDYIASLRIWLDLTRLPKPFQVEALGVSQWNLSSNKLSWRMPLPVSGQPYRMKDQ